MGAGGFGLTLTGRARVCVDDVLVVDAWGPSSVERTLTGTTSAVAAGQRHRIRIDYIPATAAAPAPRLAWAPPGGGWAALPDSAVAPRYSVPTASTADDNKGVPAAASATAYDSMANALPKLVTAGGLQAEAFYQDAAKRQTGRTMPAGNPIGYGWYGRGPHPVPAGCGSGSAVQCQRRSNSLAGSH